MKLDEAKKVLRERIEVARREQFEKEGWSQNPGGERWALTVLERKAEADAFAVALRVLEEVSPEQLERRQEFLEGLECNCDQPDQIQCDLHGPRE